MTPMLAEVMTLGDKLEQRVEYLRGRQDRYINTVRSA